MNQKPIHLSRKKKRKKKTRAQRQLALINALHLDGFDGDVIVVQLTTSRKTRSQLRLPRSFRHKPSVDKALQQAKHIERQTNPLLHSCVYL